MEINTEDEKKWNISVDSERTFWNENLIDKYIKLPKICPLCSKQNINKIQNNTLNNPILGKCTKCGKNIYLRQNSIFGLFPRTPASIIFNIIRLWLLEEKNLNKIFNYMKNNTSIILNNQQTIRNILIKARQSISHYMRDVYELEILANENEHRKIAVDESLFTHVNNKPLWVIGLIDTNSKKFRLIPSFSRDGPKLKSIITKYVMRGNIIITDSWSGYNWISEPNSGLVHITHNHSLNQFGYGDESTSNIEQLWSVLKGLFKRIYVTIPSEYFELFLREIEWRVTISNKSDAYKMNAFAELLDYISNTANFNLYELESFDNY